MRYPLNLFILASTCAFVAGCTKQHTPSDGPTTEAARRTDISQVVHTFLDAVRSGDTQSASKCLTPLSLKRTSELQLSFSPPGSDTASFQVGKVEIIDIDKAIVESTWSDLDTEGQPAEEHITWALKLSDGQWRISGMAAELGPDEPMMLMDFENPEQYVSSPNPTGDQSQLAEPRQAAQPTQDPFRTMPK